MVRIPGLHKSTLRKPTWLDIVLAFSYWKSFLCISQPSLGVYIVSEQNISHWIKKKLNSASLPQAHQQLPWNSSTTQYPLIYCTFIKATVNKGEKRLLVSSGRTSSIALGPQWKFSVHAFLESPPWEPDWLAGVVALSFCLWTHWTLYESHTWPHNHLRYPRLWATRLTGTSPSGRWRSGPLRPSVWTDVCAPGRTRQLGC